MRKEIRIYRIILVVMSVVIAGLMCLVDHTNRKCDERIKLYEEKSFELNEMENWVLDVVYETDLFEDIIPEEQKYLDELEKESLGRYYVELILLYQKYYGDK
jgi:hypothetical protein